MLTEYITVEATQVALEVSICIMVTAGSKGLYVSGYA